VKNNKLAKINNVGIIVGISVLVVIITVIVVVIIIVRKKIKIKKYRGKQNIAK